MLTNTVSNRRAAQREIYGVPYMCPMADIAIDAVDYAILKTVYGVNLAFSITPAEALLRTDGRVLSVRP